MTNKTFIIGLDGTTFDVLNPLIADGLMPNIQRLISMGSSGELRSTVPPISGTSWLSFATGKNPKKTGAYDFLKFDRKTKKLSGVSSNDFKGHSFWDIIEKDNKKIGLLHMPMLFPPYEIDGFMISGIGSSENWDISFPKELKQELTKYCQEKLITDIHYNQPHYDEDKFIGELNSVFDQKVKIAKYLIKEKQWDLFIWVISETDWIQHFMWKHIDESHPDYDKEKSLIYQKKFDEFWGRVDKAIGEVLDMLPTDINLIINSDHGFGKNDQTFNINAWLKAGGFLVLESSRWKNTGRKLLRFINKYLPINRIITIKQTAIDYEKSQAYDPGHTIPFGGIYINTKNQKIKKSKKQIIEQLILEFKKTEEEFGIKFNIVETDEKWKNAPDLIVTINDCRCVVNKTDFSSLIFKNQSFSPRHTGSHRMNGIFIAKGPNIRQTKIENASLVDIAPTVLHLFGNKIPSDIDGRVLSEIFTPDWLTQRQIVTSDKTNESIDSSRADKGREDELKQKLKDLGYM
jgi:predicted AlkP superfamily phosphohydrolase/phosphomutase